MSRRERSTVLVAPPDDLPIRQGDAIVVIAEDQSFHLDVTRRRKVSHPELVKVQPDVVRAPVQNKPHRTRRATPVPISSPPTNVAVIGWSDRIVPLLKEVDRHVGVGSKVWILSEKRTEARRRHLAEEGLQLDGSPIGTDVAGLRHAQLVRGSASTPESGVPPGARAPGSQSQGRERATTSSRPE